MKYETLKFSETTFQCFGKRGISWHGSVVNRLEIYPNLLDHLSLLLYDQITEHSAQNVWDVESLFECIVIRVRSDLPHLNEVIFVTDNAGCYENRILTLTMPLIGKTNGADIVSFLYLETRDGKCSCDSTLSLGMMHLSRNVGDGFDVTTEKEFVTALNAKYKAKAVAELVKIDLEGAHLKF